MKCFRKYEAFPLRMFTSGLRLTVTIILFGITIERKDSGINSRMNGVQMFF